MKYMKVYLIAHEGKIYWHSLEAWAEIDKVGNNGVCVRAVKAFTKLKYAKEWIKKNHCEHLEIKGIEIK